MKTLKQWQESDYKVMPQEFGLYVVVSRIQLPDTEIRTPSIVEVLSVDKKKVKCNYLISGETVELTLFMNMFIPIHLFKADNEQRKLLTHTLETHKRYRCAAMSVLFNHELSLYETNGGVVIAYSAIDANIIMSAHYGIFEMEYCDKANTPDSKLTIINHNQEFTSTVQEWIDTYGRGVLCIIVDDRYHLINYRRRA